MMKKTNKFINNADSVVDDSIHGLILLHDNLATLDVKLMDSSFFSQLKMQIC